MASYTPNLNLIKPADADSYDVANDNGNMDKIDAAYGTLNSKTPKIEYRTLTYYISENLAANETLNITIPLSPSLPFTPIGAIVQTKERNIMYVVSYFDLSASSITIRVSAGKNVTDLTTPRYISVLFIG